MSGRALAMILLFRYTALRISDVCTLARGRVANGEVHVRTLKNGKPVWLPVPPDLQKALDRVPVPRGTVGESKYFFWSGIGTKSTIVRHAGRTMSAVFAESGVADAHAHRYRHTLASELLASGASVEEVADILGDSPDTIRKHYEKWIRKRQDRINTIMTNHFFPAPRTPDVHEKDAPLTSSIN